MRVGLLAGNWSDGSAVAYGLLTEVAVLGSLDGVELGPNEEDVGSFSEGDDFRQGCCGEMEKVRGAHAEEREEGNAVVRHHGGELRCGLHGRRGGGREGSARAVSDGSPQRRRRSW